MTRIALIRHAQTEWNVARRIQGRRDSPLTTEGELAASRWAATLAPYGFDALYSSPLGRAMRTARLVGEGLGLAPVALDGLVEHEFGQWTGRSVEELRRDGELAPQEALGWAFRPPGGEDRREVLARAWEALTALAARHRGGSVLAVTHEGVIRAVLYAISGRDYLPSEPRMLAPRALHLLTCHGGCLSAEEINLTL